MAQLRQDYNRFIQQDAEVIVIGPEGAHAFQEYWKKENLPFLGLPDSEHTVLKLYGQEIHLFKLGRMPAQALIDKNGNVRYIHYGHSMADIPKNQELLELLENLNQEQEQSSSLAKH